LTYEAPSLALLLVALLTALAGNVLLLLAGLRLPALLLLSWPLAAALLLAGLLLRPLRRLRSLIRIIHLSTSLVKIQHFASNACPADCKLIKKIACTTDSGCTTLRESRVERARIQVGADEVPTPEGSRWIYQERTICETVHSLRDETIDPFLDCDSCRVKLTSGFGFIQSVIKYGADYLYRARNQVERFFNRIKQCRRVATRYDKLAANYLAFVQLASIRLWLRVNESAS
jgi:hypothetical protein